MACVTVFFSFLPKAATNFFSFLVIKEFHPKQNRRSTCQITFSVGMANPAAAAAKKNIYEILYKINGPNIQIETETNSCLNESIA